MLPSVHPGIRFGAAFALGLLASTPISASSPDREELIARKERKLASEFLEKTAWEVDFDHALARAKKEETLVFAYFTRSYEP